MRNRRHSNNPVDRLRLAIDCMPVATRRAMLEGVQASPRILVGAYVDGSGGVCPMLAAHRKGGRTDFISFAKAWDRFARSRGGARVATPREIRTLITQLQASLDELDGLELDRAIAEHRSLRARSLRSETRRRRLPEQADPRGEIRARRLSPRRLLGGLGAVPARRPAKGPRELAHTSAG
jgi:hypothetical protein